MMCLAPSTPSIQVFLKRVEDWDMSPVKQYLVKTGVYAQAEIDDVEAEYKKYIAMCAAHPGEFIPVALKLDAFWHQHILFTQDYTAMSEKVVGRYIHHRPCILDDEQRLEEAFESKTLELYSRYFGKPNRYYWDSTMCTCQVVD